MYANHSIIPGGDAAMRSRASLRGGSFYPKASVRCGALWLGKDVLATLRILPGFQV